MSNFKSDIAKTIAETFKARLKEMGMSARRFAEENIEYGSRPTFNRVMAGNISTNIRTVAAIADKLGLEIKFVPKYKPTKK